ncbi:MAG: S8 family serine peptidase [Kutzneria sp.]|nr:S8 family serine peptidase [Kutzneria sp.]
MRKRSTVLMLGVVTATAAMSVFPAVATAAPTADPSAATLHSLVRTGTLLRDHGVRQVCAAHGATPHCMAEVVTESTTSTRPLSTQTPVGYGPDELAAAYSLPAPSVGETGTIAIIDMAADPNLPADLATYRKQYGLPECTTETGCLTITDYHGGPALQPDPSPIGKLIEQSIALETSLDLDMASAACPHCRLMLVQVPFDPNATSTDKYADDFGVAVDTAVSRGANAVSISYGFPTDAHVTTGPAARALFRPGIAITASSGDSGFQGGQADWPQDLPWVTSVGGTSLYQSGARFTEQAWSGAGSGCADSLPPTVGQPATISANCGGHRTGSDVSAVADPGTGVAVYDSYAPADGQPVGWAVVGGTSASSPYLAGLYVRGGHLSGVLGPNTLYGAPSNAFNDVTFGQNAPAHGCDSAPEPLCRAGTSWDGPTGLGTPNGLAAF